MKHKKTNHLKSLKKYIHSLIENINKEIIPKNIDLILDGGAFNGAYQYGSLLYLKELEKLQYTNINRISGCSVGAILATVYLTQNLDKSYSIYNKFISSFRKTCDLRELSNIITDFVNQNIHDIEYLK